MTTLRLSILLLLTLSCHRETPVQNKRQATAPHPLPPVTTTTVTGSTAPSIEAPTEPPVPESIGTGVSILKPAERRAVKIRPLFGLPTAEDDARALSVASAPTSCTATIDYIVTPPPGTTSLRVISDGIERELKKLKKAGGNWSFTVDAECVAAERSHSILFIGSSCPCDPDPRRLAEYRRLYGERAGVTVKDGKVWCPCQANEVVRETGVRR